MLSDFWFKLLRQSWSHQIYWFKSWEIVVPFRKEFPIGTWRNIVKQLSDSTWIEFDKLVKKYGIKF